MPSDRQASSATLTSPQAGPSSPAGSREVDEEESGRAPKETLWGCQLMPNEGSTARDFLARERNFLSWIKLATTLAIISAALLIRFQFGKEISMPQWEIDAEVPLGCLFFAATLASLAVGTHGFYASASGYLARKAFVYGGIVVDGLVVGIGLLTIAACVLLLAADH